LAPRSPGETFSPADRQLLRDLATQAGAAAHAVRLTVALRSSLEELRQSRKRLVAAQEEERRRIQRDLHDGLGPVLASMRLRLEACLNAAQETKDPLTSDLERLYELVGQTTAEIRRLVYNLRPPVLDQLGLVSAVKQHCERFGRETGIEVGFEAEENLSIPAAAEAALLRVVQEALLNVGKHAHASRVEVRLGRRDGWLVLEVRDEGVGFEANGQIDRKGTGIGSMRERVELLGGTLQLTGRPGIGTEVEACIPLSEISV
jgi:signal transduction histidine kinase